MIDIILTNSERLLLREVELAMAPTNLQGAFKRIRRDPARDQYVATLSKAEIGQLVDLITGNRAYLAHVPSCRSIPGLLQKFNGLRVVYAIPPQGVLTKKVEV